MPVLGTGNTNWVRGSLMDFYGIVSAWMIFISCNNIVAVPCVYSLPSHGNSTSASDHTKKSNLLYGASPALVCGSYCYLCFKLNETPPETVVFCIKVFLCLCYNSKQRLNCSSGSQFAVSNKAVGLLRVCVQLLRKYDFICIVSSGINKVQEKFLHGTEMLKWYAPTVIFACVCLCVIREIFHVVNKVNDWEK
jgi:hypothetical protein